MKKFNLINFLKNAWPVILIFSVISLLFIANFKPNTYLIGWDNLQTELNPLLNLKRTIFSVWGEFQGLGLLSGNSNAADLPRQIILLPFSLILPMNYIRLLYVFAMLFIGTLGTYFLLKKTIFIDNKNGAFAILGSLFYLLNLSTLQTFYVPFEPFITHFGLLPWLILSSVLYIKEKNKKNLLLLIVVNLIAIPQSQVPTLFFVYLLILSIIILTINIKEKSRQIFHNSLRLIFITLVLNAFWLLPFIYFVFANSSVALTAKVNQMATETVYLQNKAFGNLSGVILLKGFWFNNVDPNLKGVSVYMMQAWRDHFSNLLISGIGYFFFIFVLIGFVASLRKRHPFHLSLAILFVISFTLLALNTFPFSIVDLLFSKIPLLHEVFRFPFTKFSILLSLTYSVFFALGISVVLNYLSLIKKYLNLSIFFVSLLFILLLAFFVFPVFQGQLFYNKEKLALPKEYFQVFDFFKQQDPNTRIADFPVSNFWGWTYYKWGYGGSGFLWHGIHQPILDTAFDVWSKTDENYYWEITNAIYSKNLELFDNVLNKYQVNWLMVDKNVVEVSSPKAAFASEIENMINQDSIFTKAASFGNIDIYKVILKTKLDKFVFLTPALPKVNSSQWNNLDTAYSNLTNYSVSQTQGYDYYYPFRSFLSSKNQENLEYKMTEDVNFIDISNPIPASKNMGHLIIPSFSDKEEIVPVSFTVSTNADKSQTISLLINPLEIYIFNGSNDLKVFANKIMLPLFSLPANSPIENATVDVNGIGKISGNDILNSKAEKTTYLSLKEDNLIFLSSKNQAIQEKTVAVKDLIPLLNQKITVSIPQIKNGSQIVVKIPKISGDLGFQITKPGSQLAKLQNCDNFNHGPYSSTVSNGLLTLSSQNSAACTSILLSTPIHSLGYAIFVNSKNLQGRSLNFWLLNEDEGYSLLNTYLKTGSALQTSTFVIPPQENYGRAYSLNFDNTSIGNDKTVNALGNISFYPIPYNFISSLVLSNNFEMKISSQTTTTVSVSHPNESLYLVTPGQINNSTIVLSQSFDSGWKAYAVNKVNFLNEIFPFLFDKEIKQHTLVNNWENGWEISKTDSNSIVIIIYLPQYLQYLGDFLFVLLIATIIIGFKKYAKKNTD